MNRLVSTLKVDLTVQLRNYLYIIGIAVAVLVALLFGMLAGPAQLPGMVPALMILVVGGTTLLYVAGMILFEKEEGTLHALMVSPLRTSEYLWSKIITLTALATLEAVVMIGGAMLIMSFSDSVSLPNVPVLIAGVLAIGIIYTLIGIILVVRFDKITDFLIPMAGVAVVLQLPFLYFWGVVVHPAFLVIPTSAPAMLMRGAYLPISAWEWVYAIAYSTVIMLVLTGWSYRAFKKHIIMKVG